MRHLTLSLLLLSASCGAAPAFAQDDSPSVEAEIVVEAPSDGADTDAASESDSDASEEADAPAEVPEDIDEAVDAITDAFLSKNWILFAGLLLILLVHVANKIGLKDRVGTAAVPWVAAGTGVAGSIGVALVEGVPVATAVMDGLLVGVTAIGGWEMLFKHVLGSVSPSTDTPDAE